jgi:3-oxoacyl-[acyl-carrier protein] reductase
VSQIKYSLVTGGLQGIGNAIATCLQSRGDRVFIFDYVDEHNARVAALKAQGFEYIQVDLSSTASIAHGYEKLTALLGEHSLDILINNAGITRDGLALRMSESDWDSVLNVNLKGLFFASQHALKLMIRARKGYIVNISSIVGLQGNPGQANYVASKAGIIGLTKTLAQEYGSKNITVNAIAPGFITTALTQALPEVIRESAPKHLTHTAGLARGYRACCSLPHLRPRRLYQRPSLEH